jgi:amino acid transporter
MVSWQSMVVIECYVISDIIQAMILVVDSSYVATRWRGTLLTMAAALVVSTFNIVLASHLSWCEGVFATIHFFAFVAVLFGLVIMAPKPTAAKVFLHFTQTGGNWPVNSLAFFVGQVSNLFVMLGSDGVAHLAEEIEDAGVVLPQSMLWSYYVNAPLTLLMVLVYCFSITSVEK